MQDKILAYILLISYIIYPLVGWMNVASIYGWIAQATYVCLCALYLVKVFVTWPNTFSRLLAFFIIIQIVYYLFSSRYQFGAIIGTVDLMTQLKTTLYGLMSFFPFYYFGKKATITDKPLIVFYIIVFVISIGRFFMSQSQIVDERNVDTDSIVNNAAYLFVNILPFIFLVANKSKLLAWLMLAVSAFFIAMGAKRGAIVAGVIFVVLFIISQLQEAVHKKHRRRLLFIILTGTVCFSVGIYKYATTSDFLMLRINALLEGDTSGRSSIYSTLYENWLSSETFSQILFGNGFDATIRVANTQAHNDWLELLTCCGLLGVILYFFIMLSLFRYSLRYEQWRGILLSICLIYLIKSLFSMGYMDAGTAPLMILLGYIIGFAETHSPKPIRTK